MTNEELVMRIAAGEKELAADLWPQVEKFIRWRANRFYLAYEDRCKAMMIDVDDLTQEGFFAMMKSVEYFDPSRGTKFTTVLEFYLKKQFRSLAKMRYEGWENNTVYACAHLDAPTSTSDERPLMSTIADENDEIEAVEHEVYMMTILPLLDAALATLTANQKQIVDSLYTDGLTFEATAERFGIKKGSVQSIQRASLRKLAKSAELRAAYVY